MVNNLQRKARTGEQMKGIVTVYVCNIKHAVFGNLGGGLIHKCASVEIGKWGERFLQALFPHKSATAWRWQPRK